MKAKNRKPSNSVEHPLKIDDTPVNTSEANGTSWNQVEKLIGKSVAVELRVLGLKLATQKNDITEATPATTEITLLQYLAGISQLFFLIKVKHQEEIAVIRPQMMALLGSSGLEAHRILFYTCDSSKKAMMRQIAPQFYFDDDEDVLGYLRSFVENAICVSSSRKGKKSFEEFFNE